MPSVHGVIHGQWGPDARASRIQKTRGCNYYSLSEDGRAETLGLLRGGLVPCKVAGSKLSTLP